MKKIILSLSLAMAGVLGFAGIAGATPPPPVVDVEAETTSLFAANAPTAVGVVLLTAGFIITMALLGAAVRKVAAVVKRV